MCCMGIVKFNDYDTHSFYRLVVALNATTYEDQSSEDIVLDVCPYLLSTFLKYPPAAAVSE